MAVREGGRPARTHYRVKERFRAQTHIELELDTGRTHQIRVHLSSAGLPLVGDPIYGRSRRRAPKLERPALHAAVLGFVHPISLETLHFEAPLPADMAAALSVLRGANT